MMLRTWWKQVVYFAGKPIHLDKKGSLVFAGVFATRPEAEAVRREQRELYGKNYRLRTKITERYIKSDRVHLPAYVLTVWAVGESHSVEGGHK